MNPMRKTHHRQNNQNSMLEATGPFFLAFGGSGIALALIPPIVQPTLFASAILLLVSTPLFIVGCYSAYRVFFAPKVNTEDSERLIRSWKIVKDARRLAKAPTLKSDPNVKETLKALLTDHRLILNLADQHRKANTADVYQGSSDTPEVLTAMEEAYQALQQVHADREGPKVKTDLRIASREASQRLRTIDEYDTFVTEARRVLSE